MITYPGHDEAKMRQYNNSRDLFRALRVVSITVVVSIFITRYLISLDEKPLPTLISTQLVKSPDPASQQYFQSAIIQSYIQEDDWVDVAIMDAISQPMLDTIYEQFVELTQHQGFEKLNAEREIEIFQRSNNPLDLEETTEYVAVSKVDLKFVVIRGSNYGLVISTLQDSIEGLLGND